MFTKGDRVEPADRSDAVCGPPNRSFVSMHGLHPNFPREDLRCELSMLSRRYLLLQNT